MGYKTALDQGYISLSYMIRELRITTHLGSTVARIYPPTHQHRAKKYYLFSDIKEFKKQVKKYISSPRPTRANQWVFDLAEKEHLYSAVQAAAKLKMPLVTLTSWLAKKEIAQPSVFGKGKHYYYTEEDLNQIREVKKEYFVNR